MRTDWFDGYLTRYMDAWNRGDLDAILTAYHTPSFVQKEGRLYVLGDESAKRAHFGRLLDGTRDELDRGTRWQCPSLDVARLGTGSALVTVRWIFERTDGSQVEDYSDSYLVASIDGRWAFAGDIVWST